MRNRTIKIALVAAMLATAVTIDPREHITPVASCTTSTPFTAGTGGYHTYRIPALVQSRGGTLVAFAEGRRNSPDDIGDIEVVARRSTDGGCTWGPLQRVADNGRDVVGNPTAVMEPATGRIILMTIRQAGTVTQAQIKAGQVSATRGRRVYVQSSADAGATWSRPREITSSVKRAGWRWYAVGPGHGITLSSGRLVIPANHTTATAHGAHLLLSDDHGATWRIGAGDDHTDGVINPDENAVAGLPDGRLYLNARDQYGTDPANRAFTYSLNSGGSFSAPYRPMPGLVAPVVKGALLQDRGVTCKPLLFSAPDDPSTRRHLTVRRSANGGRTWRTATVIAEGPAGYSDLAKINRTTVAVLHETGTRTYRDRIQLRRFTLTCP